MTIDVILSTIICLVGLLLHIALKWQGARMETATAPVGLGAYLRQVPAQTAVAVLASTGSFLVVYALEWLNPGMAFACGYMGNSVADNLAAQFSAPEP